MESTSHFKTVLATFIACLESIPCQQIPPMSPTRSLCSLCAWFVHACERTTLSLRTLSAAFVASFLAAFPVSEPFSSLTACSLANVLQPYGNAGDVETGLASY